MKLTFFTNQRFYDMSTIKIGNNAEINFDNEIIFLNVKGIKIMSAYFNGDAYEKWGSNPRRIYYPWGLSYKEKLNLALSNMMLNHPLVLELEGIEETINAEELKEAVPVIQRALLQPKTKIIIPIGGQQERWGNYLGVSKHDINIGGETLLNRIIRLLSSNNFTDIYFSEERDANYGDASKYMGSKEEWNTEGRTLFILGDVYFTEQAIHTILFNYDKDWRIFGRATKSTTGKDHAEPFAFSFYPEHIKQIKQAGARVAILHQEGRTGGAGFLYLYRALLGLPDEFMDKQLYGENFIDIDDLTDDIDMPEDYHRLMEHL